MKLSIIIPISIGKDNIYLIERLKKILSFFSKINNFKYDIIISDSSKQSLYSINIYKLCEIYDNVVYSYISIKKLYSAAISRNNATTISTAEYILFCDVDLIVKEDFIEKIFTDIKALQNKQEFKIYPCLYLNEETTQEIEKNNFEKINFDAIKKRYLLGYDEEVLYLAVNTSTILVNREHFLSIGAYNEHFKGHGYEDFELIHRLYINNPIIDLKKDYTEDYKTSFPLKYKGFRKYYAYYSLPNFFKDIYTLHLWHPRPLSHKYYKNRANNAAYFETVLQDSLEKKMNIKNNSTDYQHYVVSLLNTHGFSDKKYCGFSNLNEDTLIRNKNKLFLKRKIRKFFLNPVLFFKDFFLGLAHRFKTL